MLSEQNKKQIIENLTQGIKYHQDALDIIKTNPRVFFDDVDQRPQQLVQSIADAKMCYTKVLKVDKNNYDALRHLGILELDQGDTKKAKKNFLKAMMHHKNKHEIYNNLGSVFLKDGELDEALKNFKICLKMNSSYLPVINNLALVSIEYKNIEDSLKYASLAYSAQPKNKIAVRHYAHAKILAGDNFEGIRLLKELLLEEDKDLETLHLLGQTYKTLGNFKETEDIYNKILAIDKYDATAFYNLSSLSKIKIDNNIIERFKKISSKADFEKNPQSASVFAALYTLTERDKKFDQAIKYLHKMNKVIHESFDSDWKEEEKFITLIKKSFSHNLIEKYSKFGNESSRPIFILGMPRSGTTLIEQILSSHSQVFGAGELTFLPNVLDLPSYNEKNLAFKGLNKIMSTLNEKNIDSWSNNYLKKLDLINKDNKFVTDKLPHNFIRIGLIKILFPKAKIIYCKRDAMDNCFSLYRQYFNSPHFFFYDQKLIGQYYNMHEELMHFWAHDCNIQMYQLNHEELVDEPKKVVSDILKYCNLAWEESCMKFYNNKRSVRTASSVQVREPINRKSIQSWKKYENELASMYKILNYKNA